MIDSLMDSPFDWLASPSLDELLLPELNVSSRLSSDLNSRNEISGTSLWGGKRGDDDEEGSGKFLVFSGRKIPNFDGSLDGTSGFNPLPPRVFSIMNPPRNVDSKRFEGNVISGYRRNEGNSLLFSLLLRVNFC